MEKVMCNIALRDSRGHRIKYRNTTNIECEDNYSEKAGKKQEIASRKSLNYKGK